MVGIKMIKYVLSFLLEKKFIETVIIQILISNVIFFKHSDRRNKRRGKTLIE